MYFKILSAICFDLDQSKILLSGNGLKIKIIILSNCILSSAFNLDQSRILSFVRELREKKKMLVASSCSFSHNLFYPFTDFYGEIPSIGILIIPRRNKFFQGRCWNQPLSFSLCVCPCVHLRIKYKFLSKQ